MLEVEGASVAEKGRGDDKVPTLEFASEEHQEARAFLRERFLRAITGIVGKTCDIRMFDNTEVTAEFRGSDVEIGQFFVTELKTPLGMLPKAILRTSDIISLEMNNIESVQQDKRSDIISLEMNNIESVQQDERSDIISLEMNNIESVQQDERSDIISLEMNNIESVQQDERMDSAD